MLCTKCNKENQDGSKFCNFCGVPFENADNTETNVVENNTNYVQNSSKSIATGTKIILGVMLVLVVSFLLFVTSVFDSLDPVEQEAYDIVVECSSSFKNPSSLRLIDCYYGKKDKELTVRAQEQNGFGANTASYYIMKKGNQLTKIDNEVGELLIKSSETLKDHYIKIDVKKLNDKFKKEHNNY